VTPGAETDLLVRVMVTETWEMVDVSAAPATTVHAVKEEALRRGLHAEPDADAYAIKFRGALVTDEGATLGALGVPNGGALIVLRARRRPVR